VLAPVLSLDLRGLSFDGKPILGQLSLQVSRGETLVLTGPSGIGKTSLLRILAGLEEGWDGKLSLNGRMSMVFQEPTLLPWRSLHQNLMLTTGVAKDQAEQALAEVGLGGLGDRYPDLLSLGQQRRLSLARAFAASPDVLLMDEPFVSLDAANADEMMRLFETLRDARNVATVLVTHSEAEAKRLATRQIKLNGSPAVISTD
jgi:NitT/TauT family transport system ATP-binding protein